MKHGLILLALWGYRAQRASLPRGCRTEKQGVNRERHWSQNTQGTPFVQIPQLATDQTQAPVLHAGLAPPCSELPACPVLSWLGAQRETSARKASTLPRFQATPWQGFQPFLPSSSYQRKKIPIVNIALKACHPTAGSAAIHQPELYSFMVKHFILMFSLLITDTGFKVLKPAVLSYLLGFFFPSCLFLK